MSSHQNAGLLRQTRLQAHTHRRRPVRPKQDIQAAHRNGPDEAEAEWVAAGSAASLRLLPSVLPHDARDLQHGPKRGTPGLVPSAARSAVGARGRG